MMLPKMPTKGNTKIHVSITNGLSEGGAQIEVATFYGECIFDETAKTRRGGNGIDVTLSGTAIIDGDIAPEIEKLSGEVQMNNSDSKYKIFRGRRIRDFSGIVHHTELELV